MCGHTGRRYEPKIPKINVLNTSTFGGVLELTDNFLLEDIYTMESLILAQDER